MLINCQAQVSYKSGESDGSNESEESNDETACKKKKSSKQKEKEATIGQLAKMKIINGRKIKRIIATIKSMNVIISKNPSRTSTTIKGKLIENKKEV